MTGHGTCVRNGFDLLIVRCDPTATNWVDPNRTDINFKSEMPTRLTRVSEAKTLQ